MSNNIVVVDRPQEWPDPPQNIEVVSTRTFLRDDRFVELHGRHKVLNFSKQQSYQSLGYYVSLLAHARGNVVVPAVGPAQDIKIRGYVETISDEVEGAANKCLSGKVNDNVVVTSFFGEPEEHPEHRRLTRWMFGLLQLPLMRAHFTFDPEGWWLRRIETLGASDLTAEQKARVLDLAAKHFERKAPVRRPKAYRYELAILHDPSAKDAPSNERALDKFERAAESMDMSIERIEKKDYGRLNEFDALFIRETTAVNHHTYRFARKANALGLVVIDDPESILRCTNKIYMAELLRRNKLPHPQTRIIARDEIDEAARSLDYPAVLKLPDGSFSIGSYKVGGPAEFIDAARHLLANTELILAQPFLKTDYDWRIGILDGQPLFACRYFMAKNHWQIIKRDTRGREIEGEHETLQVYGAPPEILDVALRSTKLIGTGLYGVDLKEVDGSPCVIEINDNPNIDAGVEDQILGDDLYRRIIQVFIDRIEAARAKKVAR